MDERVWLHYPPTGGHFHCPADAVAAWCEEGWQPCDPPTPPDPAVAERVDPASVSADRDDKKVKRNG